MQQTQRIAIAGQVQARAEILANRYVALMEGEAETMSVTFDGKDQRKGGLFKMATDWLEYCDHDEYLYQFNAGLLTEEQFEVSKKRVVALKANCELRGRNRCCIVFRRGQFYRLL